MVTRETRLDETSPLLPILEENTQPTQPRERRKRRRKPAATGFDPSSKISVSKLAVSSRDRPIIEPPKCLASTFNYLNQYAMPISTKEKTISCAATLTGIAIGGFSCGDKIIFVLPFLWIANLAVRRGITMRSDSPYRNQFINARRKRHQF